MSRQVDGDVEPIMQHFEYDHLSPVLQDISKRFADLAWSLVDLPRGAERSVALRKLLEGKDAAVRAALVRPAPPPAPPEAA